jgi:hypothetical protein
MDAAYRKVARLIHVDVALVNRPAFTPGMAAAVADEIADLLGPRALAHRSRGPAGQLFRRVARRHSAESDYSLLIIRPGTVLSRAWPTWGDLWPDPRRFLHALKGRKENCVLAGLASQGRVMSVNHACADDAARLAGLEKINAAIEPAIVPYFSAPSREPGSPNGPYLLTVARLDGMMKAYVKGLVAAFAELSKEWPLLRL